MSHRGKAAENLRKAEVLSRKLNILLDIFLSEDGTPQEYPAIRDGLAEQGVSLSRSRWQQLKSGATVSAPAPSLLRALAAHFDVDERYLLEEDGPVPERIQKELGLLQAMRKREVMDFAVRSLSDVDEGTLEAIMELLRGTN